MGDFWTHEDDVQVHLRLPSGLHRMAVIQAKLAGIPLNWWIIKTLDKVLGITGREPRPRQIR